MFYCILYTVNAPGKFELYVNVDIAKRFKKRVDKSLKIQIKADCNKKTLIFVVVVFFYSNPCLIDMYVFK